ncbi:EB domain-containing protein [Trichonephila clavata]|uniref:EB domain-containing protein n=1 Tax=Trichonephila clavata TaxID=2740835 RepID=A0A8X6GI61_TRICU|nr:EB domain-containing protein [Trichonephila clavata]
MKFQRYSKRCEKCNTKIAPDFTVFGHSLRQFFIQKDYLGEIVCPEDTTATLTVPTVFLNLTTRNDTSYCLPTANLTDRCSFSVQCQYDHGLCLDGRCICDERYFELEGRCEKEEKSHLIPIIVGSAIGGTIALTLITYCWMSRNKKM